jgi:hypothetical protein
MVGAGKRAKPKNLMAFGRNPLLALAKQPISRSGPPGEEKRKISPLFPSLSVSTGSVRFVVGGEERLRDRGARRGRDFAGLEPDRGMSCFAHRRCSDVARRQDGLLVFVFFLSIPIPSSNSNLSSSNLL